MPDTAKIEFLGLDRVLKRGTGETIEETKNALLIRDSVSRAYLLACEDAATGMELLDRHIDEGCRLLMVPDIELGRAVFEKYGFSEKLECFQAAYYGPFPAPIAGVSVRKADRRDLPLLLETYDLISPEEMEKVVERGSLLLAYVQGQLIGFIGEHLEGSMGLLYIFPAFRRRGYAAALEKSCIALTMEKGFVPFGQVEKDNFASLRLQQKLGMSISPGLICWMWR